MTRHALGQRAVDIGRGNARAAALARQLAGTSRQATQFEDLVGAPEWLGWPPERRQRLGRAAALAAIAPALAVSVDGRWLGALAKVAGDDLLDWARSLKPAGMEAMPVFAAGEIDAVAASALRNAVPPSLRDHAAPRGSAAAVPPAALAMALVQCST